MDRRVKPARSEARKPALRIRLFHFWLRLRRPMTLGMRGVVFDAESRSVFLVRHTYVEGWYFPGGGVEPGESTQTALARELAEEGNIEILGEPELKSFHFNRQASARDHVAVYLITDFRQTHPHVPDREIAEARFFPLDALPQDVSEGTRRRIAELFHGAPVSDEW
ncbi:NUDIX domain-containing protein [Nitratireductor sp. ZSWI3]|uniref:NUDIX domain-containing protein n=1 Tax=Nitratireductor sp. ZSWI3 TaxID=2966359 RepID=UPI00214FEC87|nr:NUDIX domain-containing protein [Nitratireductor sp. ZSWI3]MCR4265729.1 NUDIX domain-containing protein [Nitratireductor sp. ZSWI3]